MVLRIFPWTETKTKDKEAVELRSPSTGRKEDTGKEGEID